MTWVRKKISRRFHLKPSGIEMLSLKIIFINGLDETVYKFLDGFIQNRLEIKISRRFSSNRLEFYGRFNQTVHNKFFTDGFKKTVYKFFFLDGF
jgi:hypothetical protein